MRLNASSCFPLSILTVNPPMIKGNLKNNLNFHNKIFFLSSSTSFLSLENAKGKNWNNTKKSGKNMTCKFQPVSVEAEVEQWAAGEPSIQRTSGKGAKRKQSVKDDGAPCPQKMAHDNKRVRLRKKIPFLHYPLKCHQSSCFAETS